MGIVAPDPNLASEAAEVGVLVSKSKYRGIIYAVLALAALVLTVVNAVCLYLVAQHVLTWPDLLWLGAVNVAFPYVSGAVHALSKANTK